MSKQDVICLDSSGDEDEKVDSKLPTLGLGDGKTSRQYKIIPK